MAKTVSERALLKRVNRKLRAEGTIVRRCPITSRNYNELGDYYEVNESNVITSKHLDIVVWAREMGVMREDETLA